MDLNAISKSEATMLRRNAKAATQDSDKAQWEQALALHRIKYSGYASGDELVAPVYELWGYEDWYSYIETEIGIHVGKANRMVSTAQFFNVKMKDHWNGKVLSMTKMHSISSAKAIKPKELNKWINKAADMTPCELDHELHGRGHGHKRSVSFTMTETQSTMIKEALDAMMTTGQYESRADALVSLVQGRRRGLRSVS